MSVKSKSLDLNQLTAWSTFGTAVATLLLFVGAVWAGWSARGALRASREANEQAKRDSVAQTRPYVYAEVIPGMHGIGAYDLRIRNTGKSAALGLTLEFDRWPDDPDDVADAVELAFKTSRTLPPDCSLRMLWRLEAGDERTFQSGRTEVGLPTSGTISVRYTSSDEISPTYTDEFTVMIDNAGFWPVPESGPEPTGLHGADAKFYALGRSIARNIGNLGR